MKNVTIAGNIGKNAETRTTPNGDKVTSWTVGVDDRTSKEKGHDVVRLHPLGKARRRAGAVSDQGRQGHGVGRTDAQGI